MDNNFENLNKNGKQCWSLVKISWPLSSICVYTATFTFPAATPLFACSSTSHQKSPSIHKAKLHTTQTTKIKTFVQHDPFFRFTPPYAFMWDATVFSGNWRLFLQLQINDTNNDTERHSSQIHKWLLGPWMKSNILAYLREEKHKKQVGQPQRWHSAATRCWQTAPLFSLKEAKSLFTTGWTLHWNHWLMKKQLRFKCVQCMKHISYWLVRNQKYILEQEINMISIMALSLRCVCIRKYRRLQKR